MKELERKLTRRRFVMLSFGVLGLGVQAKTLDLLQRLEELEASTSSDAGQAHGSWAPAAQYLQGRPSLSTGFTLRQTASGGSLSSRDIELSLNDSAFVALSRCDGRTTVQEICDALSEGVSVQPQRVQGDVVTLFDCLYRLDVVTFLATARLDKSCQFQEADISTWETVGR